MDVKKMVCQVGWGILRQSVQAWFQPEFLFFPALIPRLILTFDSDWFLLAD
jgi:hypothetical protein